MLKIKRAYEVPDPEDGFRILVDRLWPRGVTKEKARIDLWLKEIAPSPKLRKWYAHDLKKWESFQMKYETELKNNGELIKEIKQIEKEHQKITLIYSTKDIKHNSATILFGFLKNSSYG